MECIEKGHIYRPKVRTVERKPGYVVGASDEAYAEVIAEQKIIFINKQPGQEHDGTTTQEVLRILIDRTRHCANCMPHPNNERIVWHLRMALVLHEARALERKVDKGDYMPEYVVTGEDGHFDLSEPNTRNGNDTDYLVPHRHDWDRPCNHPTEKQNG